MNARKIIFVLTLSLIPVISAQAQNMEWSSTAKSDINKVAAVTWDEAAAASHGQDKVFFEKNEAALKSFFPTVDIDDSKRTIKYRKGAALKGIARRTDVVGKYKEKALKFVQNVLPNALGTGETLDVLYVEEDYGAEQKKDAVTGDISPDVALKTYSYNVRIGRRLQQKPILNSMAAVEIDSATDEVVSFGFRNWEPISFREGRGSTRLSWEAIRDKVQARLRAQEAEAGTQITGFKVNQFLGAWLFDETTGEVMPAFVHYGIVYVNNVATGKNEEKQYAFVERLDGGLNENSVITPNSNTSIPVKPPERTNESPSKKN